MELEVQLRAAEARKLDLERQHGDAVVALRGCGPDGLEGRQSRVRELEKKVALEKVRCEELQLELATIHHHHRPPPIMGAAAPNVKNAEIERIMAKIEQDNRILAELEHTRSTTTAPPLYSGGLLGTGGAPYKYNLMTTTPFIPTTTTPPPPPTLSSVVTFSNPLTTQFNNLQLKMKALDDVVNDLVVTSDNTSTAGRRFYEPPPPQSRILLDSWPTLYNGLEEGAALVVNRPPPPPPQVVDMLDIPGKGRCSVYIARYSYEPDPETDDELYLQAGDYVLVWGEPVAHAATGFFDAELLDGRHGLVAANFVQRLIGDDLLEFHQAVLSTLRDEEFMIQQQQQEHAQLYAISESAQRMSEIAQLQEPHPQDDEASEGEDDQVPAPRHLTLERQLNKSVLISWSAPEPGPGNHIESYHVYVDSVLKATIKASERTRALVEGVDSNRPHRISVRSVTLNRRTSRDAACTMIIGRDTHQLGPSAVRASNITSTTATISWLPANSNHQHVVSVNSVEVRTVKPGIYRHTITGLTANTQYRVAVRAKHHQRAILGGAPAPPAPTPSQQSSAEDLLVLAPPHHPTAAYTDFRTLPKGLPDPPNQIQVEAGPQDGTLLVTWQPILPNQQQGSVVTGYAVYADGKKVTDVDSPTGDHALIDISKLLGLNPRHVTVRTKARDGQSNDSVPTPIPNAVLMRPRPLLQPQQVRAPPTIQQQTVAPPMMRQPLPTTTTNLQQQQQQRIIEPEENLSDKEIFPTVHQQMRTQLPPPPPPHLASAQMMPLTAQTLSEQQRSMMTKGPHQPPPPLLSQQQQRPLPVQQQQKKPRWFVALFDYDPVSMSPNPESCEEELPFTEGDTIKVWGEKDADGFYWGECRGRRGYVPHNMVMEVDGTRGAAAAAAASTTAPTTSDTYIPTSSGMKRMVALYDYDPQELSPNVDAEQVELSFTTGQIINVYGEMDDDGFYMGEIEGVRGLVPSNFLTEAPPDSRPLPTTRQQQLQRGIGPGARGPPPPPRDSAQMRSGTMRPTIKDSACVLPTPTNQLLLDNQQHTIMTTVTPTPLQQQQQQQQVFNTPTTTTDYQGQRVGLRSAPHLQHHSPQQPMLRPQLGAAQIGNLDMMMGGSIPTTAATAAAASSSRFYQKGVPQVVPNINVMSTSGVTAVSSGGQAIVGGATPNIMQKINEITAPGGDILNKGKELIFMKFGLGGGGGSATTTASGGGVNK